MRSRMWLDWFRRWRCDRRGATAIEYGMIAALIAAAVIGGVTSLGGGTNALWGRVSTAFETHIR